MHPQMTPDALESSGGFILKPDMAIQLLTRLPIAVVGTNKHGKIILVNLKAELLFRYQAGELYGESVDMLLPEALRELHAKHREKFYTEPRDRSMGGNMELKARRKDGSEFDALIELISIQTTEGLVVVACVLQKTVATKA